MGSWGGVKTATCGGGEGSAGGSGQAEEEQECVDPALVAWAVEHMPATARAAAWLQPFKGQMKVALCAHLDIKNAIACKAMVDNGIAVYATTCNPATVRPAVLAFLEKSGVVVDARRGAGGEEWAASVRRALLWGPDVLCEMGGHLSEAWHALPPQQRPKLLASVEATGSGVHALQRIAPLLDYPVFEWDTQGLKLEVHNRHMVGLTAMHAFFLLTHLTLHFKTAAVFGYGPVGEGVAKAARAYGAQQVVVVEKDSTRAVQARMDNFQALVLPPRGAEAGGAHGHLREVLAKADVVVTATGVTGVFGGEQAVLLKPGAFVMNVGHENTEIDLPSICGLYQGEAAIPDVTRYSLRSAGEEGGGMEQACPHFFLITDGCMANLASPRLFGDSLNAFDALLATMMGALRYVMAQDFKPAGLLSGLHRLPDRVSAEVADILMQR